MSMFHPRWLGLLLINVFVLAKLVVLRDFKRLKDSHVNSQKHIAG